jgi:hypothetical protein
MARALLVGDSGPLAKNLNRMWQQGLAKRQWHGNRSDRQWSMPGKSMAQARASQEVKLGCEIAMESAQQATAEVKPDVRHI